MACIGAAQSSCRSSIASHSTWRVQSVSLRRIDRVRRRAPPYCLRASALLQRMASGQLALLDERKATSEAEYEGFKKHFPEVRDITAAELHELLEKNPDGVVLIDVRTPEERRVSQLPGPVLTPEEFDKRREELQSKLAVCYCTAGMRSGKHAAKLQKEGVDTKNLRSSLVAWTQEGYPLVRGDGSSEPTKQVHAFGPKWASQMGDGYELLTFNKAKGAFEITKTLVPKWLGGAA